MITKLISNRPFLSTGGRLHWLHAQPARTGPGEGGEEEGGALRTRGGVGGELHCHCTVTLDPNKGPISTDTGDKMTSEKGYFYTVMITFVIIPTEYLQSTYRVLQSTAVQYDESDLRLFFMDFLTG